MGSGLNKPIGDIPFDEKAFLRKARFKSILRIIIISLIIAIGVFVLTIIISEMMLQNQENRINSFYPDIVKFTEPNTFAISGESYNVRLFGRQKEYYLLRLIGNKPYPAGIVTVDFDIWGGEQFKGDKSLAIPEGTKEYLAPYAVPKLKFYNPAVKYDKVIREFDVLKNIPNDNLVEMALSFDRPLTLSEIKTIIPEDLKLMWGAVLVYEEKDYKQRSYLAERLVGNPYVNSPNGEKEFLKELERLSNVQSYSSTNLKRTVNFLKENVIKYYGVVVVGHPESLQELSSNSIITGAVLGIVTEPY
ncbi:sigma factor regulator N-terminal domain-containing protein [Thermoanaerobacter thermohydrosulfuricus]|uniref:sigma factor regulator N-terminal domain-containing protein n=1 Tax=Thermoanaerobacter sp. RKWS2 TaxID=2983842 RepID=UPI00224A7CF4|nr:sigma factor regulator N-terminal domain-containing protein [Thermoanaerobacter sp. RKWS2]UZQ82005.1 sigma factor regulator N-terminal domain-containing protein [Thermoanaerobacter sp. RKWS2]